jgi:hypothetical protein
LVELVEPAGSQSDQVGDDAGDGEQDGDGVDGDAGMVHARLSLNVALRCGEGKVGTMGESG